MIFPIWGTSNVRAGSAAKKNVKTDLVSSKEYQFLKYLKLIPFDNQRIVH